MYIVICDRNKPYINEIELTITSHQLEWDIITGQYDNPEKVLFLNPEAGICTDISAEMAGWIVRRAMGADWLLPHDVINFCECHGAHVPARLVA